MFEMGWLFPLKEGLQDWKGFAASAIQVQGRIQKPQVLSSVTVGLTSFLHVNKV